MVRYSVNLDRRVRKKDLARLEKADLQRVVSAIGELGSRPRPPGAEKLTVRSGYRIRRGSYRILYTIDDQEHVVTVHKVAYRREAYR